MIILFVGAIFALNAIVHHVQSVSVVSGTISVPPGATRGFGFAVPSGATNAHVTGSFTASGGSGNDIKVYVDDSHANALYSSGQVSTGNFDVQLPAGFTYLLFLDNSFSTLSTKTVQVQATLSYNS